MQRVITQYSSSTIPICLPSGGLVGGLPSEGIHTEDLLSRARATDFGFGILPTRSGGLRSGGLHSGGLLSKATDFGSGILPTRSEGLRVFALGIYTLRPTRSTISGYGFRLWVSTCLSVKKQLIEDSSSNACFGNKL